MKTVILADNQYISRAGWHYLFISGHHSDAILECANKKDLITKLLNHADALIVLDYTLFDFESVNELIILQQRFALSHWIIFSESLSIDFLKQVLYSSDNCSILLKDCQKDEIQMGLTEILKGNRFVCNEATNLLLSTQRIQPLDKEHGRLTSTEKEILREIALGKTTKEIAAVRYVSAHTIMTHRKNIFRKIEVNNVYEATRYAMRAGIVDPTEYYI